MAYVLNSLFRFFQSEPEPETSPPPSNEQPIDKGEQHETSAQMQGRLQVQVQTGGQMERKPSFFSLDRSTQGPPHIAWVIPTPNPTPTGSPAPSRRSWPPKPANRASTPLSLADGSTLAVNNANPSASTQQRAANRTSSDGRNLQSMYYLSDLITESETSSINTTVLLNKPLTPAGDNVQFPASESRPPVESAPPTPDSTRLPTPSTPGFLTRPLNRTISQTSTSTFGTASTSVPVMAPIIPPLDLRPNFAGSLGVPPRRSQLPAPSLPTVIGSPRPQVSVIYEDSDPADSFRTALSVRDPSAPATPTDLEMGFTARDDPFADPEDVYDAASTRTHFTGMESHMSISDDAYEEVDLGVPEPEKRGAEQQPRRDSWGTYLDRSFAPAHGSVLDTMSRRSHDSEDTVVESAIKRRWLQGLSFGSYGQDRGTWKSPENHRLTSAFFLFWLGFVAPWCWLIGGWYLARNGELKPSGQFSDTVEQKWPRRRSGVALLRRIHRKERHLLPFWRSKRDHKGKSPERMPMSPLDSNRSVKSLDLLKGKSPEQFLDPWVRRCRTAALVTGFMLVGVVITLIVVAGVFA